MDDSATPATGRRCWARSSVHRKACILAALRALDATPREPKVTRQGLRQKMLAAFAAVAERGLEALPPKPGCT